MTLIKVPTTQTTYTEYDFVKATILAWQEMYNEIPKKETVYILLAQTSHETGFGKACWNWNLFNVKAKDVAGQTIEYVALNGVWEIVNGKRIVLPQDNPGSWFRAFHSLSEGIKHHFQFLNRTRYASAFLACKKGNLMEFCSKLREGGYYTDSLSNYTNGLTAYYKKYINSGSYDKIISSLQNPLENKKEEVIPEIITISPLPPVVDDRVRNYDVKLYFNLFQQIIAFILKLFKK